MDKLKLIALVVCVPFIVRIIAIPIKLSRIECAPNPYVCLNPKCNVTTIRKRITLLNFGCHFEEPGQDNISVHLALYRKSSGSYRKWIVDGSENLCDAMDKTSKKSLLLRVLPTIYRFSAGEATCPLKGDTYLVNSPLDLRFVPNLLPAGDYRLNSILQNHQHNITRADVFFRIG